MTSQTTSLISFPLLVEYSVNSNESRVPSEGKILKTSLNIFSKIHKSLCFQTEKTKLSKDCWLCLVGGVYNITHQISQESWSKGLFSLSVIPWTDILHIDLECGKSKDTSLFIKYTELVLLQLYNTLTFLIHCYRVGFVLRGYNSLRRSFESTSLLE